MDDGLPMRGKGNLAVTPMRQRERAARWHAAWRRRLGVLAVLLSLGIVGCDTAPRQSHTALPPQPASKARFYFFREMTPYTGPERAEVLLNDVAAGVVAPGSVIYRDVAPGLYGVGVRKDDLAPTPAKMVAVEAGTSTYVRIESLSLAGPSGVALSRSTLIVAIVDPVIARRQIEHLRRSDG